ncbi:MAG: metallophosphoesterase family protein, partial [Chloroflexota bacterium]
MERITIFSDIHGNLPALTAVFADMKERGLDNNWYCLGDLVGYGTSPNEIIDKVRERDIPTIMGNYDDGVGRSSDDCGCAYSTDTARRNGELSIAWTNKVVNDERKAYLRGLHKEIPVQLGDLKILLVHGSPRKINEYLYEDRGDKSLERVLDGTDADVLVCGHTHLPYHKVLPSGRQIVNAGSVGKPKDNNPDACYITLTAEGDQLSVDFIRVPYDVEVAASAIEAA